MKNIDGEFVLDPALAQEIQFSVRRNVGSTEDLKWLSSGENFRMVTLLRTGQATPVTVPTPEETQKLLIPNGSFTVNAPKKPMDLDAFFKDRSGLWVSDSFRNRAKAHLKTVKPTEQVKLSSSDLSRNAYDREIKPELPANHEVDEMFWTIAAMIEAQEGGKEGLLLNNGHANLFYVSGFVVNVRWNADYRRWYVHDRSLGGHRWRAGDRVFSRN